MHPPTARHAAFSTRTPHLFLILNRCFDWSLLYRSTTTDRGSCSHGQQSRSLYFARSLVPATFPVRQTRYPRKHSTNRPHLPACTKPPTCLPLLPVWLMHRPLTPPLLLCVLKVAGARAGPRCTHPTVGVVSSHGFFVGERLDVGVVRRDMVGGCLEGAEQVVLHDLVPEKRVEKRVRNGLGNRSGKGLRRGRKGSQRRKSRPQKAGEERVRKRELEEVKNGVRKGVEKKENVDYRKPMAAPT